MSRAVQLGKGRTGRRSSILPVRSVEISRRGSIFSPSKESHESLMGRIAAKNAQQGAGFGTVGAGDERVISDKNGGDRVKNHGDNIIEEEIAEESNVNEGESTGDHKDREDRPVAKRLDLSDNPQTISKSTNNKQSKESTFSKSNNNKNNNKNNKKKQDTNELLKFSRDISEHLDKSDPHYLSKRRAMVLSEKERRWLDEGAKRANIIKTLHSTKDHDVRLRVEASLREREKRVDEERRSAEKEKEARLKKEAQRERRIQERERDYSVRYVTTLREKEARILEEKLAEKAKTDAKVQKAKTAEEEARKKEAREREVVEAVRAKIHAEKEKRAWKLRVKRWSNDPNSPSSSSNSPKHGNANPNSPKHGVLLTEAEYIRRLHSETVTESAKKEERLMNRAVYNTEKARDRAERVREKARRRTEWIALERKRRDVVKAREVAHAHKKKEEAEARRRGWDAREERREAERGRWRGVEERRREKIAARVAAKDAAEVDRWKKVRAEVPWHGKDDQDSPKADDHLGKDVGNDPGKKNGNTHANAEEEVKDGGGENEEVRPSREEIERRREENIKKIEMKRIENERRRQLESRMAAEAKKKKKKKKAL